MKVNKPVKMVLIGIGVFFATGIIGAAMDDTIATNEPTTEAAKETSSASTEVEQVKQTAKSLFDNPNAFKTSFNGFCTDNDFDMAIADIDVQEGDVKNTFTLSLTENVALVGTVDKSEGSVNELIMIGTSNGTPGSGMEVFTGIAAIIGTVDATLTPTERGAIIKALGLLDKKTDFTDHEAKHDHNGYHYWVNCNKITGINLGIAKS